MVFYLREREKRDFKTIREGEIWKVNIPKSNYGDHIQFGEKYVVVMSNNLNNKYSPNISYVVLTSKKQNKNLPTHHTFKAGELQARELCLDTVVLGESYTSIDKKYFMNRVGKVTEEQFKAIGNCVAVQSPILFAIKIDNINFSSNPFQTA